MERTRDGEERGAAVERGRERGERENEWENVRETAREGDG